TKMAGPLTRPVDPPLPTTPHFNAKGRFPRAVRSQMTPNTADHRVANKVSPLCAPERRLSDSRVTSRARRTTSRARPARHAGPVGEAQAGDVLGRSHVALMGRGVTSAGSAGGGVLSQSSVSR